VTITHMNVKHISVPTLLLQPFYGPLDFVWDNPSEPVYPISVYPQRSMLFNVYCIYYWCCEGHTRYSTRGTSNEAHCQPFINEMIHGWFAVAHNGELVNAGRLKKEVRNLADELW